MLIGAQPITFTSPSSQACQKSGSFAPPALPGINARMTLSDSRQACRACHDIGVATSDQNGSPPITCITFPTCCAHYPRRIEWVLLSIASPLTRPSPNGRRVGIRIVTFEACSGFTRVTAHRIAQPPKATFVTRLQPGRLPEPSCSSATGLIDNYPCGSLLHWCFAPSGRTAKSRHSRSHRFQK